MPYRCAFTVIGAAVLLGFSAAELNAAESPTFTKDVAPIIFDNCVTCHRPNHIAPMSLGSYEEARPWARSIKAVSYTHLTLPTKA